MRIRTYRLPMSPQAAGYVDRLVATSAVERWIAEALASPPSLEVPVLDRVEQIDAVVALVKDIVARHKIPPDRVLGHSDIAPGRKVDPGPMFPWKRLADEGLVRWPDATKVAALRPQYEQALPDVAWFQQKLARFGYLVPLDGTLDEATRNVLVSFQMKYRPARYDGMPDAECAALLAALTTP